MYPQEYSSRSPGTTRTPYNMGALNRQTSRQFNNYGGEQPNLSLFTSADHERYDPPQFDRMTTQSHLNDYHYTDSQTLNSQTWGYNAGNVNGGANTMGANRTRPTARRTALPTVSTSATYELSLQASINFSQNWTGGEQPQMGGVPNFSLQQLNQHMSSQYNQPYAQGGLQRPASPDNEELIPTAIVIKNIPFAVKKEQLVEVMCDKGLPLPYAFNYHFDNGVFRGLAFANFTTAEETSVVINTLNHMDLNGRKLRVEYKKMLPAHERDRIERDKRERRGQLQEQHQPQNAPMLNNPSQLHNQGSMTSLNSGPATTSPSPLSTRNNVLKPPGEGNDLPLSSAEALLISPTVDLNDPVTLGYFSELNLFVHDSARETLIFPAGIPPKERRDIHELAHGMGLYHRSEGMGDNRQVTILKHRPSNISPPVQATPSYWNEARRGLARAATIDFSEARESGQYNHHTLGRQASDLLNIPGSPGLSGLNAHNPHNLRAAKSFADLRSYTPSPVPSTASFPVGLGQNVARYTDYSHGPSSAASGTPNLTPTSGREAHREDQFLLNGMGNMSLGDQPTATRTNLPRRLGQDRENYTSSAGPIGSQRPGNGAFEDTPRNGVSAVPERQPRGPGAEWGSGFSRPRQNGHVNRGSGELDLNSITKAFDDNRAQDSSDRNGAAPGRY